MTIGKSTKMTGNVGKRGKTAGGIGKNKTIHGSALTLDQNRTKVAYPTTSTT